jgi:hypothetical protein
MRHDTAFDEAGEPEGGLRDALSGRPNAASQQSGRRLGGRSFEEIALDYLARGFSPLPVNPGMKLPSFGGRYLLKGWSAYVEAPASAEQIRQWGRSWPELGVALCTGYGGLIAVDVDDERAYSAVRAVLGDLGAPVKVGRRGATAFFHDPTGQIRNRNIRAAKPDGSIGGTLVEFLAKGRQAVIPPSVHPGAGRPYRWRNGDLEGCRPQGLPGMSPAMIAEVVRLLDPIRYRAKVADAAGVEYLPRGDLLPPRLDRRYRAYAAKAFENALADFQSAGRGARGEQLWISLCKIGKFAHHGLLDRAGIETAFLAAAEQNGLVDANGERDVRRSIANAFRVTGDDPLPKLSSTGGFDASRPQRAGAA